MQSECLPTVLDFGYYLIDHDVFRCGIAERKVQPREGSATLSISS
jgi:hypothetical protein